MAVATSLIPTNCYNFARSPHPRCYATGFIPMWLGMNEDELLKGCVKCDGEAF